MKDKNTKKTARTQSIRKELKRISNQVRELKERGEIRTINEGLIRKYAEKGYKDLRTFQEWEEVGRTVRKGENALYLWDRKVEFTTKENGETVERFYFPFIAVFSFAQTVKIGKGVVA